MARHRRRPPASALFGAAYRPDAGYIARRLTESPESWDSYHRLVVVPHKGGLICKWQCRFSAQGGDPWAFIRFHPDGATVTLGRVDDPRPITLAPHPGVMAAIRPNP